MVVIQTIIYFFAGTAAFYHTAGAHFAQLVGYGGLGHGQHIGKIADAQFAFEQGVQDPHTGGIAKDTEQVGQIIQAIIVGHHAVQMMQIGVCMVVITKQFFGGVRQVIILLSTNV